MFFFFKIARCFATKIFTSRMFVLSTETQKTGAVRSRVHWVVYQWRPASTSRDRDDFQSAPKGGAKTLACMGGPVTSTWRSRWDRGSSWPTLSQGYVPREGHRDTPCWHSLAIPPTEESTRRKKISNKNLDHRLEFQDFKIQSALCHLCFIKNLSYLRAILHPVWTGWGGAWYLFSYHVWFRKVKKCVVFVYVWAERIRYFSQTMFSSWYLDDLELKEQLSSCFLTFI